MDTRTQWTGPCTAPTASILRSALEAIEEDLDSPTRSGESVEAIAHGLSGRWRELRREHDALVKELEHLEGRLAVGDPAVGDIEPLLERVERHLLREGEAEVETELRDVGLGD